MLRRAMGVRMIRSKCKEIYGVDSTHTCAWK